MVDDLTPNNIELIPIRDKILIFDSESDPSLGLGARVGGLGGTPASAVSNAINNEGNLVTDIINARLDSEAETILGEFTFGASGAIKMITDANNGLWFSPTGILAKKSGANTLTVTNAGDVTMVGTITASAGSIGGWNISATALYYDGATDALSAGMASVDYPFYAGKKYADRATAPFRVTPVGALVATSATITGALTAGAGSSLGVSYLSGTIAQANLNIADRGWTQTSVFSATDLDTVSWGAGTFTSADGTAYSIGIGNTGNMAAKTYIYLDIAVSTTAYQITTTPTTAVGVGKVLIAVAQNAADTATFALTETTQIVGDNILVNTIAASKIVTGQLIVGTNVGLGTAQDSVGVTTIIGGTVTTGYINALAITTLGAVTAGSLAGVTIAIGAGNAIFKADSNGIYLGNATFASAPFRVNMAGALVATSATISGNVTITGGSGIANLTDAGALAVLNVVGDAYITDLTVEKLTGTTITGKTVQTASSGQRVVIDGSSNLIRFYDSGGIDRGTIYGLSSPAGIGITGDIQAGSASLICYDLTLNDAAGAAISFTWNNSVDIGTSTYGVKDIYIKGTGYINNIDLDGSITMDAGETVDNVDVSAFKSSYDTHAGNASAHHTKYTDSEARTAITAAGIPGTVYPSANLTYHLGSSTANWDNIYFDSWYKGNDVVLDYTSPNLISYRHFIVSDTASDLNIGSDTKYWNEINYKTLTDRGCLGVFDKGVELLDGREVSDLEALKEIKKHPTLKTTYGVPRFDYSTMPRAVFKPKTCPEGEDGAELTALTSIMIGAIKELDKKVEKLEEQLENK